VPLLEIWGDCVSLLEKWAAVDVVVALLNELNELLCISDTLMLSIFRTIS
jgi:hypothetical protein